MSGNIVMSTPGASNVSAFGTQDAEITSAEIVKSKYPETEYGTNKPVVDPLTGQPKPKWDLKIGVKGDDGKRGTLWLSGVKPDGADFDFKGASRKFLTQYIEFTGKTPQRVSDLVGSRLRVMAIPPTGNGKNWKLIAVGPAQNAAASSAAAPVAAAPVAPVVIDGKAVYESISADIRGIIPNALKSTKPEQVAKLLVDRGYVKTQAEAEAAIVYAQTLGA